MSRDECAPPRVGRNPSSVRKYDVDGIGVGTVVDGGVDAGSADTSKTVASL